MTGNEPTPRSSDHDFVEDELAHEHTGSEIAIELLSDAHDRPLDQSGLRPRGIVMTILHGYRVVADKLAGVLGVISAALIFPTVIISVVNMVLRRVGANQGRNLTTNGLIEAQWYLYTLIFVTGVAYILREGINVRVDFWFTNRSSRTQSWIDLIGHCIALIPFAYIGIKYSWPSVKLSWDLNEQSPDAGGLARYPIKTALMFTFVFLMIQGIAEIIKNIEYLRGHELRHASDAPSLAAGQELSVDDFDISRGMTDVERQQLGDRP
jgi:TRAP-type mannitol/chloroaromatic compound transport system permease small subunit